MNTSGLDYTALTIALIGAINWGLIGFFRFDLVAFLCGNMSWISRIIYALVGLFRSLPSHHVRKNRLRKKRTEYLTSAIPRSCKHSGRPPGVSHKKRGLKTFTSSPVSFLFIKKRSSCGNRHFSLNASLIAFSLIDTLITKSTPNFH